MLEIGAMIPHSISALQVVVATGLIVEVDQMTALNLAPLGRRSGPTELALDIMNINGSQY